MSDDMDRRQALKRLGGLCAAAAATSGAYGLFTGRRTEAAGGRTEAVGGDFTVPGAPDKVVAASGGDGSAARLVRRAVDELGGMSVFVKKGDVVAVKPNVSWDRPPMLAANTNPETVRAVVEMCLEAGAAEVRIVDNTINSAGRTFLHSGIQKTAEKTGADLVYPESQYFRETPIGGRRLDRWEVYLPVVRADKLINMPVAKSHGLTRVTLGMKNWIGAVGGRRGALHQDIHQSIVDLASFFRPSLVVMDATRVMLHNGPSGGRPDDVAVMNTVIAGTDQVAVDAAALPLFELRPEDVGYVILAEKQGLGVIRPSGVVKVKV